MSNIAKILTSSIEKVNGEKVLVYEKIVENSKKYTEPLPVVLEYYNLHSKFADIPIRSIIELKNMDEEGLVNYDNLSLDEVISYESDDNIKETLTVSDTVGYEEESVSNVENEDLKRLVNEVLERKISDERTKDIIELRYGFKDGIQHTLAGTAQYLGAKSVYRELANAGALVTATQEMKYVFDNYDQIKTMLHGLSRKEIKELRRLLKRTFSLNEIFEGGSSIKNIESIIKVLKECNTYEGVIKLERNHELREIMREALSKDANIIFSYSITASRKKDYIEDNMSDMIGALKEIDEVNNNQFKDKDIDEQEKIINSIEILLSLESIYKEEELDKIINELKEINSEGVINPKSYSYEEITNIFGNEQYYDNLVRKLLDKNVPIEIRKKLLNHDVIKKISSSLLTKERIREIELHTLHVLKNDPYLLTTFVDYYGPCTSVSDSALIRAKRRIDFEEKWKNNSKSLNY